MIRYTVLGLCIALLATVWATFLLDTRGITQAVSLLKSQAPLHVGIASAAIAVFALVIVMTPRLVSGKTPAAAATSSAPTGEPPVVTPKRVANRRLQLRDQIMQDIGNVLSSGLEVRHLMTDQLLSVPSDTKLADVRSIMEEEGIRHVAVSKAGEYGNIAGMISDRDVATRPGGYAMDIMTPAPMSICHGAKIQDAADVMTDRGISALLVKRGEIACGIITTTDLIIGLRATYDMLYTLVPDEQLAQAGNIGAPIHG